jgi:hypothetical protein
MMSGFVLNAFKVFIEDEESATASADPVSPILSLVNGLNMSVTHR